MGQILQASQGGADGMESWMNKVVQPFFKNPLRKLVEEKPISKWTLKEMRLFFHHLTVVESHLGNKFLESLTPSNLKTQSLPFDVYGFIAEYGEDVKLEDSEDNHFVLGILFLYHTIVDLKRTTINHPHLILVLKFDVFLREVVKIPKAQYSKNLSAGNLVKKDFIHKFCKMKISKDLVGPNKKISVVYIVTDTAGDASKWVRLQKSLLVNLNLLKVAEIFKKEKQFQYGIFHPAIMLNSNYLEWDTGSLVVCQSYHESWSCNFAKAVFHVGDVTVTNEGLKKFTAAINNVLDSWNTGKVYSQSNNESEGLGNCHKFFHDLRACLLENLPGFREPPGVMKILQNLPKQTDLTVEKIFSVALTKNLKKLLDEEKALHDLFVQLMEAREHKDFDSKFGTFDNFFSQKFDCKFSKKFPNDYVVLKAFDRGYWMRRRKGETRLTRRKTKEDKERYINFLREVKGVDLNYAALKLCPFQDPSKFTLQDENSQNWINKIT